MAVETVGLLTGRSRGCLNPCWPDNDGWTPLRAFCFNDHSEVVKVLLDNGADLTVANNYGWIVKGLLIYQFLEF